MKKIFTMMAVAIVALTFNACSDDDDNPSDIPVGGKNVITVNTEALYKELDAIREITSELTEDSSFIEGTVLVYDADGNLVKQYSKEIHRVETISFETEEFPNGTYTLVAIQRLNFHGYEIWRLVDIGQLSTVRIEYGNDAYADIQNALGIACETVTVEDKSIEANLTPKAAGSIVGFRADGIYEKSNIKSLVVYGKPLTTGLYLNPALSESERRYSADDSRYLTLFEVAKKDSVSHQVYEKFFTMNIGDDNVFMLYKYNNEGNASNVTTYNPKFTIGKETLIYYDFNDWNQNWQFCDYAEAFDGWMKEKEEAIMCIDPCMDWGCSLDNVIQYMTTYRGWYSNLTKGNLKLSNEYWYEYFKIGVNHYVYYMFETQEGQNLQAVFYSIRVKDLPLDLLDNSLIAQGYEYQKAEETETMIWHSFLSTDKKITAYTSIDKDTGYWSIWLYPVKETV